MTKIIKAPKGLEGVVVDTTSISNVDAELSKLFYRGYEVAQLSREKSFDEVAYLLVYNELPNKKELVDFVTKEKAYRPIQSDILEMIIALKDAHPMDALRTAVSFLGAKKPERSFDIDTKVNQDKFLNLYAQIPTIIASHYRVSKGLEIIEPKVNLSSICVLELFHQKKF
jgi:citrate synthase